jgi:iron-sulfur cluster assembly accessory protein
LLVILLAVFLAGYEGAYYACVDDWDMSIEPTHDTDNVVWYAPQYRMGGGFSRRVFAPAHWLDQLVRPEKWSRHVPPPDIIPPEPRPELVTDPPDEVPASEATEESQNVSLVTLTPAAAARVRDLMLKEPRKDKLRISLVEKFGGDVHWHVSLTAAVDSFDDETVTSEGLTIVLDRASRAHIGGTRVDYVERGGKGEFTFASPRLQRAE